MGVVDLGYGIATEGEGGWDFQVGIVSREVFVFQEGGEF